MHSYQISTLDRDATSHDRETVVQVLMSAFASDVALLDMTGDDPNVSPLVYRSWVKATFLAGKVDVARVDGAIQGVALWFGPGEEMLGSEEQTQLGWDSVFSKFQPHLARWWKEDYPPQIAACEQLCRNVHKSGWYLGLLAVDASQQRKGLGAALLRHGNKRADEHGVPAVLECEPENIGFYERHGYAVKGTLSIQGPTKSWRSCALRREPVPTTS